MIESSADPADRLAVRSYPDPRLSIRYPEGGADVCFYLFCLAVDDVVDAMLSYDAPNAVKIANGILAKYATFPPRDAVTSASTPRSIAETLKLFRPMQAEGISVCLPEIGMPALGIVKEPYGTHAQAGRAGE